MAIPGATVSLVRRTNFRKAFLSPWDPEVNHAWLYSLAVAQAAVYVDIHMTSLVVTHHHTDVTPVDNRLSKFIEILHGEFSSAINALLVKRGYDRPRQVWDGRATHQMRLVDEGAQCTQLVYDHLQNVAAGLVDRPEDMPGRVVSFSDWKAGGIWVPKLDFYSSHRRADKLLLQVAPTPLILRLFRGDISAAAYQLQKVTEEGIRALRSLRTRPVLGALGVTQIHPFDEPDSRPETGGRMIPSFRIGARGILGQQLHHACAVETTSYRRESRGAFEEWKGGNREVEFPFGNCQMVLLHNAKMKAVPPEHAVLTAPGPTLADVCAELERGEEEAAGSELRRQIIDESKDAFWQEAEDLRDHAELRLHQDGKKLRVEVTRAPLRVESESSAESESPEMRRSKVAVRSVGTKTRAQDDTGRMIVLRDRRKTDPKGGSDPPS